MERRSGGEPPTGTGRKGLEYDSATDLRMMSDTAIASRPTANTVRAADGAVRNPAEGWTLLRPGDDATPGVGISKAGQELLRCAGHTVKLRDAAQGSATLSLKGHQQGFTSFAFSSDRRTALTRQPRRLGDPAAIDGVVTEP